MKTRFHNLLVAVSVGVVCHLAPMTLATGAEPAPSKSESAKTLAAQQQGLTEVLARISTRMMAELGNKRVSNLAVSRVYYNGAGDHPFARATLRPN